MIRETKSTTHGLELRPKEMAKIKAAREHFKQLGVGTASVVDYELSTPGNWNL
jgi:type III restriction enzyme